MLSEDTQKKKERTKGWKREGKKIGDEKAKVWIQNCVPT